MKNHITRRTMMAGALGTTAAIPATALAYQGPVTGNLPDTNLKDLISDLWASQTPYLGAADRYSVVKKDRLNALCEAAGIQEPAPTADDPIPDWFAKWKRLEDSVNEGSLDYDHHQAEIETLSEKICTTRPTSRAGAIAQLEYAMDDFGPYMMGNIWKDLDVKLFHNLMAALKGGVV